MCRTARVAVDKTTPRFDREYDYLIPNNMNVQAGCRVTVPFGAGNKRRVGIVLETFRVESPGRLKSIATLVDAEPLLGPEQLGLLVYMKQQLFAGYFDALGTLIPAGYGMRLDRAFTFVPGKELPDDSEKAAVLTYLCGKKKPVAENTLCEALGLVHGHKLFAELEAEGFIVSEILERRKTGDDRATVLFPSDAGAAELERSGSALTPKQKSVLKTLCETGPALMKEILYFCGVTRAVPDALEKKGFIEYREQKTFRDLHKNRAPAERKSAELSPAQREAYTRLTAEFPPDTPKISLLYGVTGSGKTELFLKYAKETVARGKTVIVTVPEIALTAQTADVFYNMFGARTAVLHSSLSMGERVSEWRRIKEGGADVVVGTRSAIFAPLENIGLIVIDEEQERSYKSDASPRYHTADIAKLRAEYHGAHLVFCSATPSLESYRAAETGRYRLTELTERYSAGGLPDVMLADMRDEPGTAAVSAIGSVLATELYHNLKSGEQSILLLNRRGYNTAVKCSECSLPLVCPHCSVAMTYHAANNMLLCHYCGHMQSPPKECPTCGSELMRYVGLGTQTVEQKLGEMFGDARILRMDADTTHSKYSHEKKFGDFKDGKYDIMIGTQMVAKGLNFPGVTLVGVLGADSMLFSDDFRALERTFALITQVVGRSGRGDLPGRAVIQTSDPHNSTLLHACRQDYPAFYREEVAFRKSGLYPPFCDMVSFGFSSVSEHAAAAAAKRFAERFTRLAKTEYPDLPIRLLGPAPADIYKLAGKYRVRLLVKCRYSRRLGEMFGALREEYYKDSDNKNVTLIADRYFDNSL